MFILIYLKKSFERDKILSIQILLVSYATLTFPNKEGFLLWSAGVLRHLVILRFFGGGVYLSEWLFSLPNSVFFVHFSRCMQYLFRVESSAEWKEARARLLFERKKAEEEVHCWKGYCNQVYHESLLLCNRNSSLSIPVFMHYLMKKENKPTKVFMKFNKICFQTHRFQYIMTVQLLIGVLYVFLERLHFLEKWYLTQFACEHEQCNAQARVSRGLIILKLIYSETTLTRNHVMKNMSSSESSPLKGLLGSQIFFFP